MLRGIDRKSCKRHTELHALREILLKQDAELVTHMFALVLLFAIRGQKEKESLHLVGTRTYSVSFRGGRCRPSTQSTDTFVQMIREAAPRPAWPGVRSLGDPIAWHFRRCRRWQKSCSRPYNDANSAIAVVLKIVNALALPWRCISDGGIARKKLGDDGCTVAVAFLGENKSGVQPDDAATKSCT